MNRSFPQLGDLPGGIRYCKQGYGCAVGGTNWNVDFDFGAQGQIEGFDFWRPQGFARRRLAEYSFATPKELERSFKDAVEAGELEFSDYILYCLRSQAG